MPTNHSPAKLSRTEKALISRQLCDKLTERAQLGPSEPALDIFIPQLDTIALRLESHVVGKSAANAARVAHVDRIGKADGNVDTWGRHVESFLQIEGRRPHGALAAAARLLHAAAFPEGLAFLDDRVPDENAKMRHALTVLRAPEHAQTLAGILFPFEWLDRLEAALQESDQAYADRGAARGTQEEHVLLGKNAEADWRDIVKRLQKYVESRASAGDLHKEAENRALLAPLHDAVAHAKAVAATRKTRRAKTQAAPVTETTTTG
ncbi:hypothetical protein [Polyangium spumosum]|uniref:Uncharacterized protein n=1 Tax=Polyangium spumosum TaxID=889282 RepID=A0A6N7Q489_9BACT|nr:hypothetical protein [Polyangium spumosum]MRG97475.1 hypothetical protein [Polyangium spumosum]